MQLLPPILRSRLLTALLWVLTRPLHDVYRDFCSLRSQADDTLRNSGNVVCLEDALNAAFYLRERQIYIETPEEMGGRSYMYLSREVSQSPYIYMSSEASCYYMIESQEIQESSVPVNFVVMVPTFLCTSLDKRLDRFGGTHLSRITHILNKYRPAGRTFGIELYDYE